MSEDEEFSDGDEFEAPPTEEQREAMAAAEDTEMQPTRVAAPRTSQGVWANAFPSPTEAELGQALAECQLGNATQAGDRPEGDGDAAMGAQLPSERATSGPRSTPSTSRFAGPGELKAFLRDQLAEAGCCMDKYEDIENPTEPCALWDFWGILPHRASRADLVNKKVLLKQLVNPITLGVPDDHQEALLFIEECFRKLDRAHDLAEDHWDAAQVRFEAREKRHGRAPMWQEFSEHFLMKLRDMEDISWIIANTSSLRSLNAPLDLSNSFDDRWGGSADSNRAWLQTYLSKDFESKPNLYDMLARTGKPIPNSRFVILVTGGLPEHHNEWLAAQLADAGKRGPKNWRFGIGVVADAYEAKWPSILKYWSSSMNHRDLSAFHVCDTFYEPATRVWLTSGRSPMPFLKKV